MNGTHHHQLMPTAYTIMSYVYTSRRVLILRSPRYYANDPTCFQVLLPTFEGKLMEVYLAQDGSLEVSSNVALAYVISFTFDARTIIGTGCWLLLPAAPSILPLQHGGLHGRSTAGRRYAT